MVGRHSDVPKSGWHDGTGIVKRSICSMDVDAT